MAGSFLHMVKADGTPYDKSYGFGSMFGTVGDTVEALEECYGMIWYLSQQLVEEARAAGRGAERPEILAVIQEATVHYMEGVARGRSGN